MALPIKRILGASNQPNIIIIPTPNLFLPTNLKEGVHMYSRVIKFPVTGSSRWSLGVPTPLNSVFFREIKIKTMASSRMENGINYGWTPMPAESIC